MFEIGQLGSLVSVTHYFLTGMLPITEYPILSSHLLISTTPLLFDLRPVRRFSSKVANPVCRLLRRSIASYAISAGVEKYLGVGGPCSFDLHSKIQETSERTSRSCSEMSRLSEVWQDLKIALCTASKCLGGSKSCQRLWD